MPGTGTFRPLRAALLRGLRCLVAYPYVCAVRVFPRAAPIFFGALLASLLAFGLLSGVQGVVWLTSSAWQGTQTAGLWLYGSLRKAGPDGGTQQAITSAPPQPVVPASAPPWRQGLNATVRGLISEDTLPYTEGTANSFAEQARQVDYALIQTLQRLDLPWTSLVLVGVRQQRFDKEKGMQQSLQAHIPLSEELFVRQLEGALLAWAEGSKFERVQPGWVRILCKGQVSHIVRIFPNVPVQAPLASDAPRLCLVIDDLGESLTPVEQLMALGLPVSFSILPHTARASEIARLVGAKGYEVLMHQPAEPLDAGQILPGVDTVRVSMDEAAIARIVAANFIKLPYASALNNHTGSRFTRHTASVKALSRSAATHGLFVLDSVTHPSTVFATQAAQLGLRAYRRDFFLDDTRTKAAIAGQLAKAEHQARTKGQAIVIGHPYPETLEVLAAWARTRDAGIAIVPLRSLQALPFVHSSAGN